MLPLCIIFNTFSSLLRIITWASVIFFTQVIYGPNDYARGVHDSLLCRIGVVVPHALSRCPAGSDQQQRCRRITPPTALCHHPGLYSFKQYVCKNYLRKDVYHY